MADKEVKSVRLPADTAARVSQYAEERGISESDALRRLVEQGLTGVEVEEIEERLDRIERKVSQPIWRRWLDG
jgi:predicted DNA-binding protein